MDSFIFSSAYFPPISYFAFMLRGKDSLIEVHENYIKQSYRNRCKILSTNGVQSLSVPVEKGSFHKVALQDLRIDYSRSWQQNHIRSLKTAYNSSAFYEYMKDDIEACILVGFKFLLDLNMHILDMINKLLELELAYSLTNTYNTFPKGYTDLRSIIHPKIGNAGKENSFPEYFQVFSPDLGFTPYLSILDLMFNMGPETYVYLKNCESAI